MSWGCAPRIIVAQGSPFHLGEIISLSNSFRQWAEYVQDLHHLCCLFGALFVQVTVSFLILFF